MKNLKSYENFEQFSFLGESMDSKLQGEMVNTLDLASKAAKESQKADPNLVAAIYECITDARAFPHLSMLAGGSGSYVVGMLAMLLGAPAAATASMVLAAAGIVMIFIEGLGKEIGFQGSVTEEIENLQKCLKSKRGN